MNDHASKSKGLAWVVGACLLGTGLAVGLAPLAHIIPWAWEQKLAVALGSDSMDQECAGGQKAYAVLQQLVKRLYPTEAEDDRFSVNVHIVKSDVVNAYAELGGRISINSELLRKVESPEEVAGVLAHEIEHVHHRHILEGTFAHILTAQGISLIFSGTPSAAADWTNYFLNMSFTQSQESEADLEGLKRLQQAHVDNRGFKRFFARMEQSDSAPLFLSDHPANSERMAMADRFSNKDATPLMTPADWNILKNYCSGK